MNNLNRLELLAIVLTGLFLFSTIVCGLYLGFSGVEVTIGDKIFHMTFGFLTAISSAVMGFLMMKR